jgi:transglutaminase-like putative cysteine protease
MPSAGRIEFVRDSLGQSETPPGADCEASGAMSGRAEPSMRLLTVRHVTTYRYSEPVQLGEHRMMFRPRESHDLRLISTRLDILPRPTQLRWLHDVFDNSVAIATFISTTADLRFDSTITLEHIETMLPDYALAADAQMHPFHYPDDDRPDLVMALMRRYPEHDVDLWATKFRASSGSTGTMKLLHSMTLGIREQFSYVRRMQKGVQSPGETLRRGRGSCRDFALLMMEAVRSLGLAARFVSGYIFVPDGDPDAAGGGATHAWLQVYLPGAGWVDFDPTNNIVGNRNLIRVAVAWDPRQVLPLWGSFTSSSASSDSMTVEVSVTDESSAAARAESDLTAGVQGA